VRILWRAVLSFGPLIAVATSFVVLGEYATEFSGPSRLPDLGLLRGVSSPFESRVGWVPVQGTERDDVIIIEYTRRHVFGVTTNGWRSDYRDVGGRQLTVFARGGDDVVRVEAGVGHGLVIRGGDGNDILVGSAGDDVLRGGEGDDVVRGREGDDLVEAGPGEDVVHLGDGRDGVDGGGGRDRLLGDDGGDYLQGGPGRDTLLGLGGDDVLYGLKGGDRLAGGDGADYLDGGAGVDALKGDGGHDMIFGGAGGDLLVDEAGGDLLAGGAGLDSHLLGARSRVITEAEDTPAVRDAVRIVDDRFDFAERAGSDLEALRSIPLGRGLLAALAASGRTIEIRATEEGNSISFDATSDGSVRVDGEPGPGTASRVRYNPYRTAVGDGKLDWQRRPPIVGRFHELVHALNGARGMLPSDDDSIQRQAIGEALAAADRAVARGASTPPPDASAPEVTENAFRAFLGLPLREPD
jgi:hypothetical protein